MSRAVSAALVADDCCSSADLLLPPLSYIAPTVEDIIAPRADKLVAEMMAKAMAAYEGTTSTASKREWRASLLLSCRAQLIRVVVSPSALLAKAKTSSTSKSKAASSSSSSKRADSSTQPAVSHRSRGTRKSRKTDPSFMPSLLQRFQDVSNSGVQGSTSAASGSGKASRSAALRRSASPL